MTVRRRMLFSALATLIVLCVLLGASEERARASEARAAVNVVPDPLVLGWEMLPSQAANAWGYRERDIGPEKPPGTFRIAVLGDSVTHGAFVPDTQIYSRVLEERLHAEGHPEVQVLNFASYGLDIRCIAALMRHRVSRWKPDLVIYGYYVNDPIVTRLLTLDGHPIWVDHEERPFTVLQPTLDAWLHPHSALFRRFEGAIGARWLDAHKQGQDADWVFYTRWFDDLVAAVAMSGSRLLVLAIPPHVLVHRDPTTCVTAAGGAINFCEKNEEYLLKAEELAHARSVSVVDGIQAYRAGPEVDLHGIAHDHHHPNAEGHRRLAEALVPRVLARLPGVAP